MSNWIFIASGIGALIGFTGGFLLAADQTTKFWLAFAKDENKKWLDFHTEEMAKHTAFYKGLLGWNDDAIKAAKALDNTLN
jgi:hypothetical protein